MLIDAHTHLDHYNISALETALQEIATLKILSWTQSMDIPSYHRNREIAAHLPQLIQTSFGIHPWHAPIYADCLSEVTPYLEQSTMIGEIGLDFHWVTDKSAHLDQRQVFEHCLAVAQAGNKVVNLHTKGAEAEVFRLLEKYKIQRAIVHWYAGPWDVFEALVDYGVYFTIGIEVLYSKEIQRFTKAIPLNRLLTETDGPSGLEWLKGKVGLPRHIINVGQTIAEVRGMTRTAVQQQIYQNWCCLVGR